MKTDRIECVLGVDLGGTKIALAAVEKNGKIHLRKESPSPAEDGEMMIQLLLDLIGSSLKACDKKGIDVKAVGIGAAGYILYEKGLLVESPNIAWSMVPLVSIVSENTGLSTFLDNDANAAACGEHYAGIARGVDDFVFLTLGTGIGGGVFIDGNIYHGHRGMAAEIGHMVVDPEGPECGCNRHGCLETLASGTALEREAARLLADNTGSVLFEMYSRDPEGVNGQVVARAAESGDVVAQRAFATVAYYLGLGIVNLINLFDPELVVLGGGVSHSGHLLLDEVREVVAGCGIPVLIEGAQIVLSTLGSDAGLIGAAALGWEGIGKPLKN